MSSWNLPEPADRRALPTLRERVLHAISVPVAVGIVLFLAAVVGAVVLVAVRPHTPEPAEVAWGEEATVPDSGAPVDADDRGGGSDTVLVHVVGEVLAPGVVELDEGSRVRDAIAAAGGATEQAVLAGVNLARLLGDGEQVVVPDAEGVASAGAGEAAGGVGGAGATVDLNLADAASLEALPGVGPALAQRIISWREANGRFGSVDQLLEVPGIGPVKFEDLRGLVRV